MTGNEEERGTEKRGTLSWEEALFFRTEVPEKKKEYFPGEEVALDFSLYIARGLRAQPGSYPVVQLGNRGKSMAIFRDYRKVNSENPDYEGVYRSARKVNGRIYDVFTFRTAILPSVTGSLLVSAKVNVLVTLPEERRNRQRRGGFFDDDDDPFFSAFFSRERRVTRVVEAPPVTLSVAPLPPLEKGAFATELVGDFTFSGAISPVGKWKTGEVGNLTITIMGRGNWEFLKMPPFAAPGFRAYPAEIKKSADKAVVSYILVPLEVYKGKEPNLFLPALAWFDPAAGKYRYFRWKERMEVEKGPFAPAAVSPVLPLPKSGLSGAEEKGDLSSGRKNEEGSSELFYLKEWKGVAAHVSPSGKLLFFLLLFGIPGILFPLFALFFKKYKGNEKDPFVLRKKEAARNKKSFLRDLANIPPEELSSFAPRIASQLSDTFSLPPGSDLSAAADFVKRKDPILGEKLKKISASSFMPGAASFTEEFRKELLKGLKKFLPLFLFAFLLFFAGELSASSPSAPSLLLEEAKAKSAYDSGNFAQSASLYSRLLQKVKNDPLLYYNCGNAYAKMGDDPRALACYERALRLSPRDRELRHNLALIRKRLLLPALERTPENPLEVLVMVRDRFLPEEWGILFAAGFLILGISIGMWILLSSPFFLKWGGTGGLLLMLLSLLAILTILPGRYSGKEAVVTGEKTIVYTLPSPKAPPARSFLLKRGELVEIREKRKDWARIHLGHHEGWVLRKDITSLWEGK